MSTAVSQTPHTSSPITPSFHPPPNHPESPAIQSLITQLALHPHPEGGYYAETDRSPFRVPNPFLPQKKEQHEKEDLIWDSSHDIPISIETTAPARKGKVGNGGGREREGGESGDGDSTRSSSTTIFYLLTTSRPTGVFHRNNARTVHTLHKGRGRYVIIHPPTGEASGDRKENARLETFVVGHDVAKGERLQWIVEGGKWKASFLLPDKDNIAGRDDDGLLISETVVPGFEFRDHDFLPPGRLEALVGEEKAGDLGWLVRRGLEN